jgi:hypothetical protein
MERTFETPGPVRLFVENEVGLVVITARDTTSTVVSLQADTAGAEELVERAIVECRGVGSGHAVVVKIPREHGIRFIRRNAVSVRIDLPEGSDISVTTGSANVDVVGPVGAADLTTASGDVSTDDVAGELTAKSASGDITVGNVGGELRISTASGDLRCSRVGGRAFFRTASGDVEIGAAADRLDVKATSGNVRVGELSRGARVANVSGNVRVLTVEEGTVHVRSVTGDVSVGVAEGVDLHVDIETVSGAVHSDIPLADSPAPGRRETRVDLSVRSVSGDVEIERALEQVA